MKRLTQLCLAGLALCAAAPRATSQVDPGDAVRKIAETIEKEMSEIDRLLRESSRAGGANAEASTRIRDLIGGTRESQGKVVQGIDDLIEELEKMAQQSQNQSQQQSSQQDEQQQQQSGQQGQQDRPQQGQQNPQQGQQGSRRENQTPDLAQQPDQGQQQGEPGSQDQPQEQPGRADSPGEDPRREGRNTQAGTAAEGGTERVERGDGAEGWGSLQKYVPPQYQRAGAPQVPARYRRLHEAFQKRAHQTGKSGN